MRFDIISVLPELLESPLNHSIMKRAKEKGQRTDQDRGQIRTDARSGQRAHAGAGQRADVGFQNGLWIQPTEIWHHLKSGIIIAL